MSNKTIVTENNTNNNLPAYLQKSGAPRGSEHVTQNDLVIPRLELVQALSPCRKKTDASYIEGIEEGMLYNNVTREIYGTDIKLVPVSYRKEYLIWKDRTKGGGFRGAYPTLDIATKALSLLEDGHECEILDTAQHFCLIIKDNGIEEIVVSMAKTKLKCSRKWNSLIRITEVDSFASWYKLSAVTATNANNQEYYSFDVNIGGYVSEEVYRRAEALWSRIDAGEIKVSTEHDVDDVNNVDSEF